MRWMLRWTIVKHNAILTFSWTFGITKSSSSVSGAEASSSNTNVWIVRNSTKRLSDAMSLTSFRRYCLIGIYIDRRWIWPIFKQKWLLFKWLARVILTDKYMGQLLSPWVCHPRALHLDLSHWMHIFWMLTVAAGSPIVQIAQFLLLKSFAIENFPNQKKKRHTW